MCASVVLKVAEEDKTRSEVKPAADGAMPPASSTSMAAAVAAAPLLAWPPLLFHPWASALLPGGWCSPASAAAFRNALPGLVYFFQYFCM